MFIKNSALALFLYCALTIPASAVTKPSLPQYQVNTDLSNSPVTGKSIAVASGGDLQAAINSAQPGDEIVLQAGGTWIGAYILPDKGQTTSWITIRSSATASLPTPGNRVSPKDAGNMAKIVADQTNAAFAFANRANHYRFIGLEIAEQPKQALNYGLIMQGDPNDPEPSDLPSYITIDRCYIHGEVLSHIKFGWQMNGAYLALIDSYVSEFHGIGQDAQAVTGYMGTGPLKIVNNFLEGSGENVIFGGAYDAIPNTTTADVTFTNNYLYKPQSWRTDSIVPAPNLVSANGASGGSLQAGTYYYAVIAQGTAGTLNTPGSCQSARSNEVAVTVAPGQNAATLQWTESTYGDSQDTRMADSYVVLRSQDAPTASNRTWSYSVVNPSPGSSTISISDNGQLAQVAYNEVPRYWDVKNLLELKNGVRWLIDSNIMEGNWVSAQNGFSILFTPRNETPFMPGNRISDITFSNNIIRHVSGGINLASEDDSQPASNWPQQQATARLAFTNNLFEDVSWNYNGNGIFMEIEAGAKATLQGAQDLLFDHNTVFQTSNFADIDNCCGGPIGTLVFTNNVFGEGPYGWYANGLGQSYSALTQVISDLTFTNNVWAGDPGRNQIAGNFFPSDLTQVGFVNYNGGNGGDYHLASGTPYKGLATDGADPGANMDQLGIVLAKVSAGNNASANGGALGSGGGATGSPSPAPSSIHWSSIVSVNSGKCLTAMSDWTIAQYTCSSSNVAQMFNIAPSFDSQQKPTGYEVYSRTGATLGLNVWGATAENGAVVGLYGVSGQPNEIFHLNSDGAGNFTIVPNNSGSCLDITGISKDDGAKLQQWWCTGGANQAFNVVAIATS